MRLRRGIYKHGQRRGGGKKTTTLLANAALIPVFHSFNGINTLVLAHVLAIGHRSTSFGFSLLEMCLNDAFVSFIGGNTNCAIGPISLELVPDVLIFIQAYWIHRLDINHNALMARIDASSAEFREELQTLRAHIVSLTADVANSSQPPAPALPSSDLTVAIGDLIRSNNDTVAAIGALRAENQQLRDSVLATDARLTQMGHALDNADRRLDRMSDTFDLTVPDSPTFRSSKRLHTSSATFVPAQPGHVLPPITFPPQATPAPVPHTVATYHSGGHTLPTAITQSALGAPASETVQGAPAVLPAASLGPPAPAVLSNPHGSSTNVYVEVGSVDWGNNITGEFKALLSLMPNLSHISHQLCAFRTRPGFLKVHFNSNLDAISFVTIWAAGPRPAAYQNVTAHALN